MTTTLTIVQHGEWQRTVFAARDAIDIRITESCRYEILDWTDEGVNVERESCDTHVSAEGGGSTAYPAPAKNIAWTYHTQQPASPLSDVTLDSASKPGGPSRSSRPGAAASRRGWSRTGEAQGEQRAVADRAR